MNTAPALAWLDATFDTRRRKAVDHATSAVAAR